jgi:antirestriction protein
MLADSPDPDAEEYAVHDYEDFGGMDDGEYPDIDELAEVGRLIEEHGDAYAAYADNVGWDDATEENFQECYNGEWDSEESFAENLFDDLYLADVPAFAANYIDYAAFARDLFCGDYYTCDDPTGGVFVFRNN